MKQLDENTILKIIESVETNINKDNVYSEFDITNMEYDIGNLYAIEVCKRLRKIGFMQHTYTQKI